MYKNQIFDKIFLLTKQLKGAPLRDFEKNILIKEFNRSDGSILNRAENAVAKVLHGDPSFIREKAEALYYVKELIEDIRLISKKLRSVKSQL